MTPPSMTPNGLARYREQAGLYQHELAAMIGSTKQTVSEYERRRIADLKLGTLEQYLRACGLQLRVEVVPL